VVSVPALNKLELKEMIQTVMVENPLLEEEEERVLLLDDVATRREQLDRPPETQQHDAAGPLKRELSGTGACAGSAVTQAIAN
jgi:RNA polymerase sigma-54 factor